MIHTLQSFKQIGSVSDDPLFLQSFRQIGSTVTLQSFKQIGSVSDDPSVAALALQSLKQVGCVDDGDQLFTVIKVDRAYNCQ